VTISRSSSGACLSKTRPTRTELEPARRLLGTLLAILVAGAGLVAVLGSCTSAPAPHDTGTLSAPKLVQAAQNAADKGNYQLAQAYYQALRDRFPEDTERALWASYEIAFLQHKMGNDDEAVRLLDELIQSYAGKDDPNYPQGPRIMAEKVKANLLAKKP
jgi:outer membrane protein assembly factor BamD (BamD/ComL family)